MCRRRGLTLTNNFEFFDDDTALRVANGPRLGFALDQSRSTLPPLVPGGTKCTRHLPPSSATLRSELSNRAAESWGIRGVHAGWVAEGEPSAADGVITNLREILRCASL